MKRYIKMFESFLDPSYYEKKGSAENKEIDYAGMQAQNMIDDAAHNVKYFKRSTKYKCPPEILEALQDEAWGFDDEMWQEEHEILYISPYANQYDGICVTIAVWFSHDSIKGQLILSSDAGINSAAHYLKEIDLAPLTAQLADDNLCDQTITEELVKAAKLYLQESREWAASLSMEKFAHIFPRDTEGEALRVLQQLFNLPEGFGPSILLSPGERFITGFAGIPKGSITTGNLQSTAEEIKALIKKKIKSRSIRGGMF